jgi:hypothetical protein
MSFAEATPTRRRGRPTGKSSDPSFVRLVALVRADTKKAVCRRWEDLEPSRDLSDLIQTLMEEWLAKH